MYWKLTFLLWCAELLGYLTDVQHSSSDETPAWAMFESEQGPGITARALIDFPFKNSLTPCFFLQELPLRLRLGYILVIAHCSSRFCSLSSARPILSILKCSLGYSLVQWHTPHWLICLFVCLTATMFMLLCSFYHLNSFSSPPQASSSGWTVHLSVAPGSWVLGCRGARVPAAWTWPSSCTPSKAVNTPFGS